MTLRAPVSFVVPGHVGFCNALRRTLLSDVETEAPTSVQMKRNVTCFTDEYLAHRIGLVPFERVGNGDSMTLHARGPGVVTAGALVGPAFVPVFPDVPLALLDVGHVLDLSVTFDTRPASAHARYSPCFAVGMRPCVDRDDAHVLSFGSNDHRTPEALLREAFDRLDARLDRALRALSETSDGAPVSLI